MATRPVRFITKVGGQGAAESVSGRGKDGMGLFIHLGAHKTATTHLENCLRAAEPELLAAGVAFLGPGNLRQEPLNLRMLLNDPDRRPRQQSTARVLLRTLIADHRDLVLSEEQILGGLGDADLLGPDGQVYLHAVPRLRHLLALAGTGEVTLLLALRSPADFLTSVFGEQLRHGGPLRIEDFLRGFDPAGLRWSELVARLLAETGAARLICWRYEDTAATRSELLDLLLGPDLARAVPYLKPRRPGMSAAAYRALLDGSDGELASRDLAEALRRAHPKRAGAAALRVLPEALHATCDRLYAKDCARIAAMPGVRFLGTPVEQG